MINPLQAASQGLIGSGNVPLGIAVQGLLIVGYESFQTPERAVKLTVFMTMGAKFSVIT